MRVQRDEEFETLEHEDIAQFLTLLLANTNTTLIIRPDLQMNFFIK